VITVLANDPGTKNYGFAVMSLKKEGTKIKYCLHKTGKLVSTADIKNKAMQKELGLYLKELKRHTKGHKITHVVAERYMTRGIKGPLVESVNMMLGGMHVTYKQPIQIMPAAVWKNRANKFFDLKEFYKEIRVEAHEVDATFMAFYTAEKIWNVDILDRFAKPKELRRLKERIEECTLSPLKKPKRKRITKPKVKAKKGLKRSRARSRK